MLTWIDGNHVTATTSINCSRLFSPCLPPSLRATKVIPWISGFRLRQYCFGLPPPPQPRPPSRSANTITRATRVEGLETRRVSSPRYVFLFYFFSVTNISCTGMITTTTTRHQATAGELETRATRLEP